MKLIVFICAITFASSLLASTNLSSANGNPESLYASIGPDFLVLTVDKNDLRAELKTVPADARPGRTLETFTIAIGKELGDKQVEGDNKTPEGIYFTLSVLDGSRLPDKYGPFAIPLDYPNPIDRLERKTGYGIWLHGVIKDERVEEANVTEGCVAFYNADIIKLTRWLKPHQGVVVIADDAEKINQPVDTDAVKQATESWAEAWAQRDLEKYASFYADDFRYRNYDRQGYKEYKGRVFKSYKVMKVEFANLRVVTHPKYAVAIMDQDFFGDERFVSIGRKILYWEKNDDGSWRIMKEVHENRRMEFVQFTHLKDSPGSQAAISGSEQDDVQSKL